MKQRHKSKQLLSILRRAPRRLTLALTVLLVAVTGLWIVPAKANGTASLSLVPGSGSYNNGANISVAIHESSSDQINTVQANLVYDQSKLQFVSIDTSNSSFDFPLPSNGGGGSVSLARGISAGGTLTGAKIVGTVNFKLLVGAGSSAVSFAPSSAIIRPSDGQNVWNGNTIGSSYSFTTPAPASAPTPAPAPSPVLTSPASSGTNTPPRSGFIAPRSSSYTSPPTAIAPPASAAAQQADPTTPIAVSKDTIVSPSAVGYLLAIKVVDDNGHILKDATVTLDNHQTVKSDQTGIASFTNVSAGRHQVHVLSKAGKADSAVTVDSSRPATDVRRFNVKLAAAHNGFFADLGVGIALALLLGVAGFLLFKRMRPGIQGNAAAGPRESYDTAVTNVDDTRLTKPESTSIQVQSSFPANEDHHDETVVVHPNKAE